jgi:hypothetical protein
MNPFHESHEKLNAALIHFGMAPALGLLRVGVSSLQ